jgi:hypothetical protein
MIMWLGKGSFYSYGYQGPNAYLKGEGIGISPGYVYQVQDRGDKGGDNQYWAVPVDQNGKEIGPVAFKISGRVMYQNWEEASRSPTLNNYDFYPGGG